MIARTITFWLLGIAATAYAAPPIEHWQTSNGARVFFSHAGELPMVDIRVVFDAGGARDGVNKGLAVLTNAVLAEGAGGFPAEVISERFEDQGANFEYRALRDMAWVSLRSVTEKAHLQPALETLALVLTQPDFPKPAFERQRKRLLVALAQKRQSPSDRADEAFYQAAYGEHPYASDPNGTPETLNALQTKDLKQFYQRLYVARNAVLALVGDLSQAEAQALASTVVGRLPEGEAPEPLPEVKPPNGPITRHLPHPSTQTHIRMGQIGIRRDDPDYFPLYVGNHVLGGSGLVSRLADEVREKRGLSYSVSSYFSPMRVSGPFIVGLETKNAQAKQALEVTEATLRAFVEHGPTEKELSAAVMNLTGGFPLLIDSNAKIVEYLAMIGFYGLPADFLQTFVDKIKGTARGSIVDALHRRMAPGRLVTVTVGGNAPETGAGPVPSGEKTPQ
ncbi:MAG: M16 family metallopeptidase [Gammaproteobacteria bacterium]